MADSGFPLNPDLMKKDKEDAARSFYTGDRKKAAEVTKNLEKTFAGFEVEACDLSQSRGREYNSTMEGVYNVSYKLTIPRKYDQNLEKQKAILVQLSDAIIAVAQNMGINPRDNRVATLGSYQEDIALYPIAAENENFIKALNADRAVQAIIKPIREKAALAALGLKQRLEGRGRWSKESPLDD